jgi:hypothetical protein
MSAPQRLPETLVGIAEPSTGSGCSHRLQSAQATGLALACDGDLDALEPVVDLTWTLVTTPGQRRRQRPIDSRQAPKARRRWTRVNPPRLRPMMTAPLVQLVGLVKLVAEPADGVVGPDLPAVVADQLRPRDDTRAGGWRIGASGFIAARWPPPQPRRSTARGPAIVGSTSTALTGQARVPWWT